jgi:hypothetical protein
MRASCSALGVSLRLCSGTGSGAVAGFKLDQHGFELRIGNLLLQAGHFGLGVELAQAAGERGNLNVVLRWPARPQRLRAALRRRTALALARKAKSKKGIVICRPKLTLLGVKFRACSRCYSCSARWSRSCRQRRSRSAAARHARSSPLAWNCLERASASADSLREGFAGSHPR